MIRVAVVDDQTLVRQGIRSLLALSDEIDVTLRLVAAGYAGTTWDPSTTTNGPPGWSQPPDHGDGSRNAGCRTLLIPQLGSV
jgi:hypothetical protein